MKRSQAAYLALATVALGGCASGPGGMYSQPYALFEPDRRA